MLLISREKLIVRLQPNLEQCFVFQCLPRVFFRCCWHFCVGFKTSSTPNTQSLNRIKRFYYLVVHNHQFKRRMNNNLRSAFSVGGCLSILPAIYCSASNILEHLSWYFGVWWIDSDKRFQLKINVLCGKMLLTDFIPKSIYHCMMWCGANDRRKRRG